jgi:outer membrane protein
MEFARRTAPMYRRLSLSVLLLTSCAFAQKSLSLEEAFNTVEQANTTVLIGRELVAQAIASADLQRVNVLPRVALDAQQRRSQTVQINNGAPVESPPGNRFDGKLTGNFSVLNPSAIVAHRAARKAVTVAEFDYKQTLQNVLTAVGQTYFTHLRNLQRISVLDANIARARALLDLARRQLEAGVATQIDVTRAEAQLAITEQARLQQDTNVYQSELNLKRLLDVEAGSPLSLEGFRVRRIEQPAFAEATLPAVFDRRADYLRAQMALEQNQDQLRAAKYERLGALSLFGEYGIATARITDGQEKTAWLGGASVTVPVFDGWRSNANQRVALALLRTQELRLRNLELAIPSELRLAAQDARSRNAQVAVAERSLRLAEDELRLAQIRFERGAADNREVIEAQNRLAIASDNLVEAVYQYSLSRLELARAQGEVRTILSEKTP